MIGKTNAGGGGGFAGLNFRVIGGTSAPKNHKENDIWVNTSGNVSGWAFSASEPVENVSDGFIWVAVDNVSNVSFNALKKNAIEILPVSVYEYTTNGGWVEREAQIYQYGAWFALKTSLYIYNQGKSTGYSWACDTTMKQFTNNGYPANANRVSLNTNNVTVAVDHAITYDFTNIFATDTSESFVKIDLSKYTKIRIKGSAANATKNTACVFRVLSELGNFATDNNVLSQSLSSGTIDATIDISSINSSCYLGFTLYNDTIGAVSLTLTELWLE